VLPKTPDKFAEIFGDPLVAKGKGVEVKRSQVNEAIINYKAALAAEGRAASAADLRILERRIVDQLIANQLILAKATDEDRRKGKEEVANALQKFKTENKITDEDFEEKILAPRLRAQGLTREQWSQQQQDQGIVLSVLERELKISVTEDQMKKYYDDHPSQFEETEKVKVSHILLSTKDPTDNTANFLMRRDLSESQKLVKRKQMEELLKRARAGEDFTKLAKEFSEDLGVKQNDGQITIDRGNQAAPREFIAAAFSLEPNQVSEVITSVLGFHIIKLVEKIPAKKLELAKVSDRLKQVLKQQEIVKQMPNYVDKLEKDANVEILDEKLKALDSDLGSSLKSGLSDDKK
jgi:parvulin-like peptidyl-prolyl isomerase